MGSPKSALTIVFTLCALSSVVPSAADAYATVASPPIASPSSGLPDARVYELASPFNKHGYQAGAVAGSSTEVGVKFSIASPDGNAVAFRSVGPAADTNSGGLSENFVAERTSHGWTSRSTTARGLRQNEHTSVFTQDAKWSVYSPNLSHLAYQTDGPAVADAPVFGAANFYLLGSNPLESPTWLLQGVASPSLEGKTGHVELVGMSPDASVVYFASEEHLLPQDASRSGWGLYESRRGVVSEAGVLPDGSVPASGAMPFATDNPSGEPPFQGEAIPASLDNQLSEDGMRMFFVSAGELYAHEIEADGSERSVLVSGSQLLGHVGEAAPDGVVQFENLTKKASSFGRVEKSKPTYAYASSDGSHVFFQSIDQMTSKAPSAPGLKTYDFDVDTSSLEYLPGVSLGGIVTAAKDGSSFVFVDGTSSPPQLNLWTAGTGGGAIRQITQLPGGGFVGPGRMVDHNSVLVFQAQAPIVGFNNAKSEQIYRYDARTNELGCVSCPPAGVAPSGDAYLSAVDQYANVIVSLVLDEVVNDVRGVSADGSRIFFASPDPLVGRDTNGIFDTYEWEDGHIFLISSGTSSNYSMFLDNSESGGDVFFTTSDELVQGDNDAAFDVYDARIPRPGDNPPPSAAPCSGDVCQGPPSVPQLLGAPPSAIFNGTGNILEERHMSSTNDVPKALSSKQKLARALNVCRKRRSRTTRIPCERRARKHYQVVRPSSGHNGGRSK